MRARDGGEKERGRRGIRFKSCRRETIQQCRWKGKAVLWVCSRMPRRNRAAKIRRNRAAKIAHRFRGC